MGITAEDVVVQLQAKIAQYKADLTDARAHSLKEFQGIEKGVASLSDKFRFHTGVMGTALRVTMYGALAALPLVLTGVIAKGLEYAGSLREQAQQVGVTAKSLQEYRYAASQVGVSTEQMDRGLAFLTRSFGQAEQGAKKPIKALQDLGFNAKQMSDLIQNGADNALPKIADAMQKITDPAARARIEIGLFGRAGQALDPLLRQGAAGIDGLRNAVEQLGGVLTDEQIEKAHQAEIRFKAVGEVLQAQIAGAVANNANAILGLANSLLHLVGVLAQIPDKWDQAMARIAQADLPIERAALAADKFMRGGASPTGLTNWIQGNITADQQRIQGGSDATMRQLFGKQTRFDPGHDQFGRPLASALPPVNDYTGAINKALTPKEKKGPKGEDPQVTLDRFFEQEASLQERINTAMAELAGTAEARAKAEKDNLDQQLKRELAHIDQDKHFSAAQKATLANEAKLADAKQKEAIDAQEADRKAQEHATALEAGFKNDADLLHAQEALVTTRQQRIAIEKKLVDDAIEEERIAQQAIVDSRTASAEQKAAAQARLAVLPTLRDLNNKNVDLQNQSPLQSYVTNLRNGLANVNDTLEQLAVDQVKKLEDTLAGATSKALGLHGALGDIVTALIRIGIQQAELAAFGGKSGGGIGDIFSAIASIFGGSGLGKSIYPVVGGVDPLAALPPRAGGGPVQAGMEYEVGEQGREKFIAPANGMIIPNSKLQNTGRVEVCVVANEYFDARVGQVTGPVIAQASMRAAVGGSAMAQRDIVRNAQHRLG